MKTRLSQDAENDLAEAADHYEAQMQGLGVQFLDEAEAALNRIAAFLDAWQELSANIRRCRLRRFPYGLIYRRRSDEILVIVVGHLHREPGFWTKRDEA